MNGMRTPLGSAGHALPHRLCPACEIAEPIGEGEAVWPAGHACPACGHIVPLMDGVPLFAPALADTISGFDPKDFENLAKIEGDHFWFVPRNRLLSSLMERYFPSARNILELGCGNGAVLSALARNSRDRRFVGSELHPTGLVVARRRLGTQAEFVQMDARRILAEQTFDMIGAFDVIEHIAEDEEVMRSAHRALRLGGGVMIAVPQHPWLWSSTDDAAYHVRRYRRGEMEEKLDRNGFRVVFSGSYCTFLLPLMIASRWLDRLRRKSDKASTVSEVETRPSDSVNRALTAVLQAEVSATLAGARFPLGGSRIVVAMRR